jgi:hypothetical protein
MAGGAELCAQGTMHAFGRKWFNNATVIEGALRDPGRMLENAAEPADKLVSVGHCRPPDGDADASDCDIDAAGDPGLFMGRDIIEKPTKRRSAARATRPGGNAARSTSFSGCRPRLRPSARRKLSLR